MRRALLCITPDNGMSHLAHFGDVGKNLLLYPRIHRPNLARNHRGLSIYKKISDISVDDVINGIETLMKQGRIGQSGSRSSCRCYGGCPSRSGLRSCGCQANNPQPGELVHIDIMKRGRIEGVGHRITSDRSSQSNRRTVGQDLGREYLHVAIDDRSRLAYSQRLPSERKEDATAFLGSSVAWFKQHGVTRPARNDRQWGGV